MVFRALPYTIKLILFVSRFLVKLQINHTKVLKRTLSNTHTPHIRSQTLVSQSHTYDLSQKTLIFDVEGTLLRSSSVFPYFMLVAFEAGSVIRAFVLFTLYPFLCLVDEELSIKVMVMVTFFGIKKNGFRVGSSVLHKFFLEDVGMESFEVFRKGKKKIGVSKLPQVMVESFLKDYLEIDHVFGRELEVFGGRYYLGLMKDNKNNIKSRINEVLKDDDEKVCFLNKSIKHDWTSCSKEVYVVSDGEKKLWQVLPRERYPKALIFHDGRLAFRPDPINMLVMFMWFPMAICLSIFRCVVALTLPYGTSIPILSFSGMQLKITNNKSTQNLTSNAKQHKGRLYICNHRTLLDPLYLAFGLKRPFIAVTYSLSRMSEILSPIKTVRLTRDRDQDAKTMDKMLKLGDLVVCPEGTTCREPYLLRFSPLFAELSDHIVPVALDTHVSMFYGTTASGLKCLDPFLFMMNPNPLYRVRFLDQIHGVSSTSTSDVNSTRFDVANYVQSEIGKALEFECTSLTRKDKYLVLAGNEGVVSLSNKIR
ncbi:probable glycerol-3-phosphate acyltransferase 3 [Rutidosis leptorrhynchoides]|uniref:probable glycerol-3-phosphate acyltransferase 3 n=1 Tax=Rutidosis leptorrhynchoides TaxID=125765 RepID=UPI003A9937C3